VTWRQLHDTAASHLDAAAGYYNNNVRVDTPNGPVNVRIPIHGAEVMDLRLWDEQDILPAIAPYVRRAPRLLHVSQDPAFQVHDFIEGQVLNDFVPRGVAVPGHVLADVVQLLLDLTQLPREKLPATPPDWPEGKDTAAFGHLLSELTERVYATFREEYAQPYGAFGFPDDPLAAITDRWSTLTPRPLTCVHSDIHRKNMIIDSGETYFLDWELALWGDPVYDLSVHFHKMVYTPEEQQAVTRLWLETLPAEYTAGWQADLDLYLAHEQIKSAVVDTVRSCLAFAQPGYSADSDDEVVRKLVAKLNNAHGHWETSARIDATTVESELRHWAETH
jgi:aminoglycoside phosphotransferase (APT) family kinase protein